MYVNKVYKWNLLKIIKLNLNIGIKLKKLK